MIDRPDDAVTALLRCARWARHWYAKGPVLQVLMHSVVDMAACLRGTRDARANASVRLQMRDGVVFGLVVRAQQASLLHVVLQAGECLTGQRYDESEFGKLNAVLSTAFPHAEVRLIRDATVLPRPLFSAQQISRIALHTLNLARGAQGVSLLTALPHGMAEHYALTCSHDHPAVHAYCGALTPEALRGPEHCGRPDTRAALRLAYYNFVAAPGGDPLRRAQALQVLPWLGPLLTAPPQGRDALELLAIRLSIDAGEPLFAAASRAFQVPREVIRWLGKRRLPDALTMELPRVARLLTLLSWLPPEWRPQNRENFEALIVLGGVLAAPLALRGSRGGAASLARFAPCVRRWMGELAPRGWDVVVASVDFDSLSSELADARDFLAVRFEEAKVRDGLPDAMAEQHVLRWCSGLSLRSLRALSAEWHRNLLTAESEASAENGLEWPAVLAQPWHYGDIDVVELTSERQLRLEGQAMLHCVGTYAASCASGDSIIVSLRNRLGHPLSTAQLALREGAPRVLVVQHRAARNALVSGVCTRTLAALLTHLNKGLDDALLDRRARYQREQRLQCSLVGAHGYGQARQAAFGTG